MLWNVMFVGYIKVGEVESVKCVFSDMFSKDDVFWSIMIVGFVYNGSFYEVFFCFRELR